MDLAKVHVAGRVVGCGRALGHRGTHLIGGHGKGKLTCDVGRGQALGSLELLGTNKRGVNGIGAVDVLEQGLDATVVDRCRQGTVTVIDDDNLKAKVPRCSGNAVRQPVYSFVGRVVNGPSKLTVLVGTMSKPGRLKIGKHLGVVVQRIKAHVPADIGLEIFITHKLTLIGDAEPELAVGHRAAGQSLGGNDLSGGAARRVGRSAVTVVERHQGLLDLALATLVDRLMRALGTAGNGRRSSERAGGVVGDGDRHRAHGVVVGVTGLAVVLLGHGVRKGLAGVSLRKYNLMTSQNVDQSDRCLCRCGGLEAISPGQQTERASRSVVSRCHGKGELTLGHGAAVQILAEPQTAGSGVVKLSAVRVGKASVFLLGDVGGQGAIAVLSHGHFGGCDMRVIRHADRAARVLANLVLIGSGGSVVNLAELDGGDAVLRVLLAHGHGCGIRQRGALGSGDGKAKLVPIRPVAAVNGLAQAKVELGLERGHAVGVLELGGLGALQDMLGLECAVAVIGDGRLDGELGVTVGDTAGVALDLVQRVGVRSGLGVLDGAHRDLAIGGVLAGGDDLGVLALALDELEGELALSHVAPGQNLGRGDLVGDARLNRRHAVGIGERKCRVAVRVAGHAQFALAVIGHGEGNRMRRLGVVGHASDLAGLGHGVGKGVLALLGLLAQSLVKVVERKGNLVKVDLALGIIGHARVRGHGRALFTGHGKGKLAGNVSRGQAIRNLQILLANERYLDSIRGVGVLELDTLDVLGALQLMRSHQLALAVIADGRHDGVDGFVVGDAAGIALDLAQRVDVLTDLGVLDSLELNIAVGVILDGLDNLRVFALALDELEGELAGLEVAAVQDLANRNLIGDTRLGGLDGISVLELNFARGLLDGSLELALCVGCHRYGELCNVLAVGDAVDRGPSMLLANLVDIRARFVVGNLAKANVRMALGRNRSRGCRHRGTVLGRQTKLKLVLFRPLATLEHLGQAKASLGVNLCRRHVVLIADLAVVAQVGIDMRRGRLGGHVVPPGVEHVERGLGQVAAHTLLGGVELVDKGQARGSHAKRKVIVLVANYGAVKLRSVAADKLDDGSGGLGLVVLALLLKLILVVIGAFFCQ